MNYAILFAPRLRREMERLPKSVLARVDAKVASLAENPRPHGAITLTGPGMGYRLRVGDYRVLYEIDDTSRTVILTAVAHRRESYR